MTISEDTKQALDDARRLFEDFVASPWRSLEISCGSMQLAISRFDVTERLAPQSDAGGREECFSAPHVATLHELAPIGSIVRAGEAYATFELLEEVVVLLASQDMRPTEHLVQSGALLQFGEPIMRAVTI